MYFYKFDILLSLYKLDIKLDTAHIFDYICKYLMGIQLCNHWLIIFFQKGMFYIRMQNKSHIGLDIMCKLHY